MPWKLPRPQSSLSSLSRASRLSRSACRAHVFPNPHLALGKSVDEAALDRLFRVPSSYLICIKILITLKGVALLSFIHNPQMKVSEKKMQKNCKIFLFWARFLERWFSLTQD